MGLRAGRLGSGSARSGPASKSLSKSGSLSGWLSGSTRPDTGLREARRLGPSAVFRDRARVCTGMRRQSGCPDCRQSHGHDGEPDAPSSEPEISLARGRPSTAMRGAISISIAISIPMSMKAARSSKPSGRGRSFCASFLSSCTAASVRELYSICAAARATTL
jgi:hypothetical protein